MKGRRFPLSDMVTVPRASELALEGVICSAAIVDSDRHVIDAAQGPPAGLTLNW
jgi:hypothetical protein